MEFPQTIAVNQIDRKNPQYKALFPYWERLRKLYEGGQTMQECASEFLIKRPMEPNDVYADRLIRFAYVNHLGNIIGWYVSALFKESPQVIVRPLEPRTDNPLEEAKPQADVLAKFLQNCDGAGRSLFDFWVQDVEPKLLLYRSAYVLFDLPKNSGFATKAQQMEANALQGFLISYAPQDIINWDTDEQGNLTWLVLKVRIADQENPLQNPTYKDRWFIYDRSQVAAYEAPLKIDEAGNPILGGKDQYGENAKATLVAGYPTAHALSDKGVVPVFLETVHHNHWIANRVSSPLCRLLNLENGYDWSLEQTNLAMLVLFTEREFDKVTRAEAAFLQLGPNDKAQFLEQSGHAFTASQSRINELREEVYRLAYLIDQGRSSSATASSQSGFSKEQDKMPARDVLSALGDRDRNSLQRLIQIAADRMDLPVDVDLQGFDFSDRSEMIEMEVMERGVTLMPITSPTLEREVQKRTARMLVPDANRETLAKIDDEIDTAATPSEQEQAQQELQNKLKLQQVTGLNSPKAFADADAA